MTDTFFKHALALVESADIGPKTRIWAWAHVMEGARLGADCNIGEHCFVERGAILGDRVTVKNGVAVWDGVTCEDDVFLGPNAVLTNDLRPRSKVYHESVVPTLLKRGATVGANAVVICGVTVGRYALIGAGSVVTKDVADHALVRGNPARWCGYVCSCAEPLAFVGGAAACSCGRRFRLVGDRVEPEQT